MTALYFGAIVLAFGSIEARPIILLLCPICMLYVAGCRRSLYGPALFLFTWSLILNPQVISDRHPVVDNSIQCRVLNGLSGLALGVVLTLPFCIAELVVARLSGTRQQNNKSTRE